MGETTARTVEVRSPRSVPAVPAPSNVAGYAPSELDSTIQKYIAVAEQNIRHTDALGKKIKEALKALDGATGTDAFDTANKVTILWERLAKTGMALTKATDELTRLRSFLAGGPDSRPDLTVSGELQLRGIVLKAVKLLGKEEVLSALEEV